MSDESLEERHPSEPLEMSDAEGAAYLKSEESYHAMVNAHVFRENALALFRRVLDRLTHVRYYEELRRDIEAFLEKES